jgi:hypothetical protein
MPATAEELAAWHLRPGAFERLTPPWDRVLVEGGHPGVAEGSRVLLKLRRGPITLTWEVRHRDVLPGRQFVDEQVRGPFARWVHTHRFLPGPGRESTLEDEIDYALPLGALGAFAGGQSVRRTLEQMFAFRHLRTRTDLERHRAGAGQGPLTVAVTGASGLVGSALRAFLTTGGHTVLPLVRRPLRDGERGVFWDPERGTIDAAALEGVDAVVHLAGENVGGGRWTSPRKEAIRRSRAEGTLLLARTLAGLARKPRVLVCASAIGIYGDRGDEVLNEGSDVGHDFLAEVGRQWEDAAGPAAAAGIRTVRARIGVVLSARGGMLERILPVYRMGLGGALGNGRQWMSWIALDDLVGILHHAIFDEALSGPVNAVAPRPVRQAEFARVLGRALGRPALARVPATVVRALAGEMGEALVLGGARVEPRRLLAAGFRHRHPDLEEALRMEIGESNETREKISE